MDFTTAYDAILAIGASAAARDVTLRMRQAFEARTGAFGPEDPWFEARSRAFWDDALATQGFPRHVEADLDAATRAWIVPLERAHRGLFRASEEPLSASHSWTIDDLWSGASFLVAAPEPGLREALASSTYFDGRIVGRADPLALVLMPGAVFHPADAKEPIEKVLEAARARGLSKDTVLDALLRMERNLRSHSRVKAAYAYRSEALPKT
ncbi:MAG: hypothetical protein JWM74_5931 [Myxococcaceae bacterium]|jgi:hypothetical protein|nr:hypothetical protein [Myxococcaceae bacterium]